MIRFMKISASLVGVAVAATLAGCSLGPSSLSTGSLFGSGSAPAATAAAAAPVATPTDRAVHVGTTVARAQRCGYVFDPQGTRAGYLAFEANQGTTGEALAKAEKSYDYTAASIGKAIAGSEDYCDEEQTATIKRDLNKVLAGDFSVQAKKPGALADNWWGNPNSNDKFDPDKALHKDKNL